MQSQRVVDSVTQEADGASGGSQRGDDAGLLRRCDTREDRVLAHCLGQFCITELCEIGPHQRPLRRQRQLCADLFGNSWVVTGRDLDLDAEAGESVQRFAGRRLRDVGKDDETIQSEPGAVLGSDSVGPRGVLRGDGDDASAVLEQRGQRVTGLRPDTIAALQHLFRRALDHQQSAARRLGESRCGAAGVVERKICQSADIGERLPSGPQRRVEIVGTDPTGRRVEIGDHQCEVDHRVGMLTRGLDRIDEFHPPLGQGSGLVRDENVDVAEVFDANETFDQHLGRRQAPRSGGQAGADDGGQQLWGDSDGDGKPEKRRVDHGTAQQQVGHDDDDGQCQRHAQQQVGEPAQTDLEGRLRLPLTQSHCYTTELGLGAGREHHGGGLTGADHRPHERDVGRTLLTRTDRFARLLDRGGLAGQDALVALEAVDLEESDIGRHQFAEREANHVTGHQVCDVDTHVPAVSDHHSGVSHRGMQRCGGSFRAVLVDEAEPDAEREDDADDGGLCVVAEKIGQQSCRGQQAEHRVGELTAQDGERADVVGADHVGSESGTSRRGFGARQPVP